MKHIIVLKLETYHKQEHIDYVLSYFKLNKDSYSHVWHEIRIISDIDISKLNKGDCFDIGELQCSILYKLIDFNENEFKTYIRAAIDYENSN